MSQSAVLTPHNLTSSTPQWPHALTGQLRDTVSSGEKDTVILFSTLGIYRIAGNIGVELYLVDWWISCHIANIKSCANRIDSRRRRGDRTVTAKFISSNCNFLPFSSNPQTLFPLIYPAIRYWFTKVHITVECFVNSLEFCWWNILSAGGSVQSSTGSQSSAATGTWRRVKVHVYTCTHT